MSVSTPGIFLAHNSFLTLVSILRLHIGVDIEGNLWNIDEWHSLSVDQRMTVEVRTLV